VFARGRLSPSVLAFARGIAQAVSEGQNSSIACAGRRFAALAYPVAMSETANEPTIEPSMASCMESSTPAADAAQAAEAQAANVREALVGRRLLALFYDLWPVVAIWFLISGIFTVGYTLSGHAPRENIAAFSPLQWLLWLCCWLATGAYAVISWARGGQTLGMRPWRVKVVAADGSKPSRKALILRFAVGHLSLLLCGLGFWWAWIDREKRTWHDRASGTRVVRVVKQSRQASP
jgi:uncharacterized RDD family membrane protein YckC